MQLLVYVKFMFRGCQEKKGDSHQFLVSKKKVTVPLLGMRIGKVIGTVTLNRPHPSLAGATFKLVAPLTWDNLAGLVQLGHFQPPRSEGTLREM